MSSDDSGEEISRRWHVINNRNAMLNEVFKRIKQESIQELFECCRIQLKDKSVKQRSPDGTIRIMDCLLIFVWRCLFKKTLKQTEEFTGISDSSLQRQEEWILENVIFFDFFISQKLFYYFSDKSIFIEMVDSKGSYISLGTINQLLG